MGKLAFPIAFLLFLSGSKWLKMAHFGAQITWGKGASLKLVRGLKLGSKGI